MFVSVLIGLFVFLALILAFFVLMQPSKGDIGSAFLGNQSQMLFGGSGGLPFFQKATWVLGAIFMAGALWLTVMRMREVETSRIVTHAHVHIAENATEGTPSEATTESSTTNTEAPTA